MWIFTYSKHIEIVESPRLPCSSPLVSREEKSEWRKQRSNRFARIPIAFLRLQCILFVWLFIWFYDNDDDAFSKDLKFNATFFCTPVQCERFLSVSRSLFPPRVSMQNFKPNDCLLVFNLPWNKPIHKWIWLDAAVRMKETDFKWIWFAFPLI